MATVRIAVRSSFQVLNISVRLLIMLRFAPIVLSLVVITATASPAKDLVAAARAQIGVTIRYDSSYQRIAYPGGDVPRDRGVCTDVVIRAYRALGIDLQKLVHEDMRQAWQAYPHPTKWGMKSTDTNIDHRRVPNLATFFLRHGTSLAVTARPADFRAGDIVTWQIPPNLPHIGIVSNEVSAAGVPLVIHNIGYGATVDDTLFAFPITGHYRYP
jgi:uncharacterized protein YijF (DUF1287 family)